MSDVAENDNIGLWFIMLGMLALSAGLVFGLIGATQFLFPGFIEQVTFFQSRPLHVSLVVSWIFLVAVGGIYYYLPRYCGLKLYSEKFARLHFWMFLVTGLAIIGSYLMGRFGGREYWEYPPVLSIPIGVSWVLFGVNYFLTVARRKDAWPVYLWMWGTGAIFFLFTFSEAHLWLLPYFRDSIVRELTVQWKAYGSLVGSWNMLVYGTAIFVMSRITGNDKAALSKTAFALYFIGLTNLMFGWSHHNYPIPNAPFIRNLGYLVSMTELLLLGKIIHDWRHTLSTYRMHKHRQAYGFLFAGECWVFLNLILALIISVPAPESDHSRHAYHGRAFDGQHDRHQFDDPAGVGVLHHRRAGGDRAACEICHARAGRVLAQQRLVAGLLRRADRRRHRQGHLFRGLVPGDDGIDPALPAGIPDSGRWPDDRPPDDPRSCHAPHLFGARAPQATRGGNRSLSRGMAAGCRTHS